MFKLIALMSVVLVSLQLNANDNAVYEKLLPQYITWAIQTDAKGMKIGKPLDEKGILLAKEIGITSPEKVRIVYVDEVPYPYENEQLKQLGLSLGFIGEGIRNEAQAFGYSIYVRKDLDFTLPKLAHELVHVQQIERANSFSEYAFQYLMDLAQWGYEKAPLEVEAFKANEKYKHGFEPAS
ncbi:hypothetical protein [Flocculibacter collagenilyticus]|uniref:hypothetical protein n=1 Tax=Flocculibacter collagenilyticus TaxID=2744479 RepID=UPI0018F3383A|nr:hypothetical protein [Flocculibacter collagenilyticus]